MSRTQTFGRLLGLAVASSLGMSHSADAGCKCRGNASASMAPVPMEMPFGSMQAQPVHASPVYSGAPISDPAFGYTGGRYPGLTRTPAPMTAPEMRRPAPRDWEAAAPPGTLGRTYKLCSRPLPEDEHPRNAGLEIKVPADGIETIRVEKMEDGYVDENGVWHFITEKPLLPHTPPIVKVVMTRIDGGSEVYDVRVVRLIPGRVLTVEF